MNTCLVNVVATCVCCDEEDFVAIMGFGLNVTDVTMQLSPWLCPATIFIHKAFTCNGDKKNVIQNDDSTDDNIKNRDGNKQNHSKQVWIKSECPNCNWLFSVHLKFTSNFGLYGYLVTMQFDCNACLCIWLME